MVKDAAEERMWCSHCGVLSRVRREGTAVKACSWCGKVLEDETGTAEQYTQAFLRITEGGVSKKRRRRCRSEPILRW